jgi:hypothetical protein
MARLRSSLLGLFVIGALVAVGCGDDPATTKPSKGSGSDDDDDDDSTSKKDAGKKDAGKATDAGKKDAGAAAVSVECGSKTCTGSAAAAAPGIPAPAPCCFDEEAEVCGVSSPIMPGVCGGPVEDDDRCPTVMALGMQAAGCCIEASNHCGINASALGAGCADLASPMLRQFVPGAPPAVTCDGDPIDPPAAAIDAGTPTTGDAGKTDAGKTDAGAATDAGKTDAGKTDAGKTDAGR